jgi:D-alanine-D-alanine ligase
MNKAVILINKISDNPSEDELDVLDQAQEVENAMKELGYECHRLFLDLNLDKARANILDIAPKLVFNLVESISGKANLIYLAPALLESMHIPYTGCRMESMFITSNKLMTKKILNLNKISTPLCYTPNRSHELSNEKTYIAKPLWEDASVGITDKSVFKGKNEGIVEEYKKRWTHAFFIEEYIDGREFNLSVIGGKKGPRVMPPAEMLFNNYPGGKPKIVGYAAKWERETFEYNNTWRTFDFDESDKPVLLKLEEIALQCWELFNLKGYCRVDFRVSHNKKPYVLEINSNPCISPDAGFFVACNRIGMSYKDMVEEIIYDAFT